MAVSQADIDALNTALAGGELRVRIGDKDITYRSVSDLILARNTLQKQINDEAVAQRPRVIYHTQRDRGL